MRPMRSASGGGVVTSSPDPVHTSGYDPETGICWHFNNKGDRDRRCNCPACSRRYGERTLAWFGRCRSGSRWFWAASLYAAEKKAFGWLDTEDAAVAAAMAAVRDFRAGLPMIAWLRHGWASATLKKLNEAKRAARSPSNAKDSNVVEYLYGYSHVSDDLSPYRFRITKKTAKRVYYIRGGEWIDEHGEPRNSNIRSTSSDDDVIGYVNRQKLEADGHVHNYGVHWCREDHILYASLQLLLQEHNRFRLEPPPDLHKLKAEMAAAHPDRGGSSAAFIEARSRYVAARRAARMAGNVP
jgi:hypothetical protein